MANPKELLDIGDQLGLVEWIRRKLFGDPDIAADKIIQVLEELSQALSLLEGELASYLSLSFEGAEDVRASRKILLELEGGGIRIERARMAMNRVANIYQRHLQTWLRSILDRDELHLLSELFGYLEQDEPAFADLLQELEYDLRFRVRKTIEALDLGSTLDATRLVGDFRQETLPRRIAASRLMGKLFLVEAEIIRLTRAA